MAHFVETLSGDGFLNLDTIDGILIMETRGMFLVIAERHDRPNTILGQRATRDDALDFIRALLGDAIHEGRQRPGQGPAGGDRPPARDLQHGDGDAGRDPKPGR